MSAHHHTYGTEAVICRGSNNYGPRQYPEKLIPLSILNALHGDPLPVYGDGRQVRNWLYVEDFCRGIHAVLEGGRPGEAYNVGGPDECENIDVVRRIIELTGRDESLIEHVTDRPGHDRRYSLSSDKLRVGARLGGGGALRRGPGPHGRLVPRQRGLVGPDPLRRVPRLLREALRPRPRLSQSRGVTSLDRVFRDDPPALELRGLTKRYDDGTLALEDFDLEIHSGAFFGLLGPNGAGKTTLISAVCNLLRITDGEVLVFGEPHDTQRARSWVGLAEQDINLDRFLTVRETLEYHGGYFGMDKDEIEGRAEEMIRAFGLTSKRDVRAPKLSGGQRRRLLLARALMHRPRLVILDEPTAGVDFELRQELWAYIRQLHSEGTTILLTTHYLDEAELLCEEIALIRGGHLIARDSADGLREHFGVNRLEDVYVKAMAS